MSATLSCFGGKDSFQVVAVYPSGRRFAIRDAHDTLNGALLHLHACQREGALDWTYEIDVTYTGSDGCRHWRGNVDRELITNRHECSECGAVPGQPCYSDCMEA